MFRLLFDYDPRLLWVLQSHLPITNAICDVQRAFPLPQVVLQGGLAHAARLHVPPYAPDMDARFEQDPTSVLVHYIDAFVQLRLPFQCPTAVELTSDEEYRHASHRCGVASSWAWIGILCQPQFFNKLVVIVKRQAIVHRLVEIKWHDRSSHQVVAFGALWLDPEEVALAEWECILRLKTKQLDSLLDTIETNGWSSAYVLHMVKRKAERLLAHCIRIAARFPVPCAVWLDWCAHHRLDHVQLVDDLHKRAGHLLRSFYVPRQSYSAPTYASSLTHEATFRSDPVLRPTYERRRDQANYATLLRQVWEAEDTARHEQSLLYSPEPYIGSNAPPKQLPSEPELGAEASKLTRPVITIGCAYVQLKALQRKMAWCVMRDQMTPAGLLLLLRPFVLLPRAALRQAYARTIDVVDDCIEDAIVRRVVSFLVDRGDTVLLDLAPEIRRFLSLFEDVPQEPDLYTHCKVWRTFLSEWACVVVMDIIVAQQEELQAVAITLVSKKQKLTDAVCTKAWLAHSPRFDELAELATCMHAGFPGLDTLQAWLDVPVALKVGAFAVFHVYERKLMWSHTIAQLMQQRQDGRSIRDVQAHANALYTSIVPHLWWFQEPLTSPRDWLDWPLLFFKLFREHTYDTRIFHQGQLLIALPTDEQFLTHLSHVRHLRHVRHIKQKK